MDIRLKNKMKKYFNNIWLIEIVIVVIITMICIDISVKYINSPQAKDGTGVMEAVFDKDAFYKNSLKNESKLLSEDIYKRTNGLNKFLYSTENEKDALRNNIYDNSFYSNKGGLPENIYFVIRNKFNDDIFTNDPFFQGVKKIQGENLYKVINEKYKGENIVTYSCNNVNIYNKVVEDSKSTDNDNITYSEKVLKNFEEIYYTQQNNYAELLNADVKEFYLFISILVIDIFLICKIIYIFLSKKGRVELRGNVIKDIIYIFRHVFKYKGPRRAMLTAIVVSIIFYIIYLYLLALGGDKNNIIVNFFGAYPFKGSLLIVALPMIGVMYSIKRNIEIGMVKDDVKIINDGNFEHSVKEIGGIEIRELIENINRMKEGYNVAVDEALQNEKLKTELISNVSHDLKTPLTSIINYVNILQDSRISEEERMDYLKILEQKSNKLKTLIEDLFEVSKINSGRLQLHKEEIDIVSLIYQVIGEYSSLYEDKGIEFKVECDEDEIIMDLDGIMISRVIENIAINSLKYSLEDTRVYAKIIKEDNGVLISFKNVANYEMDFNETEMFERFARGDKSRTSSVEGSGLGLAITKSIVELHGGTTRIKREGDLFKIYVFLPFNPNIISIDENIKEV
ncbi:sensor histidine kinase [Clostridium sardiniense]|uniref:histidine kinase n=1 Tax=Clostridium sardiniense TaxID=29369 RepID=A0ABS7KVN4_CLOSR|nr:histidine kinase dimerization/phospho-acceptor domain-containing protein [Clostridium sardiniense]MBY0754722.1 sensor histidine kinase [Clostridium sardiniense]MDQ0460558.1 signal transduction histidine kinase [Clostridium sardiniense]